jgi:hypothetical protein
VEVDGRKEAGLGTRTGRRRTSVDDEWSFAMKICFCGGESSQDLVRESPELRGSACLGGEVMCDAFVACNIKKNKLRLFKISSNFHINAFIYPHSMQSSGFLFLF